MAEPEAPATKLTEDKRRLIDRLDQKPIVWDEPPPAKSTSDEEPVEDTEVSNTPRG